MTLTSFIFTELANTMKYERGGSYITLFKPSDVTEFYRIRDIVLTIVLSISLEVDICKIFIFFFHSTEVRTKTLTIFRVIIPLDNRLDFGTFRVVRSHPQITEILAYCCYTLHHWSIVVKNILAYLGEGQLLTNGLWDHSQWMYFRSRPIRSNHLPF